MPVTGLWCRFYSDTGLAMQGDGVQITASNVIVMLVQEYPTQYVEDDTGAHENELVLTGSGPAWVFRDGETVLREVGAAVPLAGCLLRGDERYQDHADPRQHLGRAGAGRRGHLRPALVVRPLVSGPGRSASACATA